MVPYCHNAPDAYTAGSCAKISSPSSISKGPIVLIGWLALFVVAATLSIALVVWLAGVTEETSLFSQFWSFMIQAMITFDVTAGLEWPMRVASFLVLLVGVFVMSTLIGVLTTGLDGKLNQLRKGRSRVIESGHTVILGWSQQVFTIIPELVIANQNQRKSTIVILGAKDKVEMEDELREQIGRTGRTRIVCRTGSPLSIDDLELVSLQTAKSIIILPPEADGDPDPSVIQALLAVVNSQQSRPGSCHIVAALQDPRNLAVAQSVAGEDAEMILASEIIARIMAQTCRQSGLSAVYLELLDFGGDEIYFNVEPRLVGQTFGEALLAYADSAVIGLCPKGGQPRLNPPMATRFQAGDQVIAISEDDDKVVLSGLTELGINTAAIRSGQSVTRDPAHILLLGWNHRATSIINQLDNYVAPGSTIAVVSSFANSEAAILECCPGVKNLGMTFQRADTISRPVLDGLPWPTIKHVIILAYSADLTVEQADARTLVSLLHLRDIMKRGGYAFSIVSEMLDAGKLSLVKATDADDFVVSDRLVSLMLAQISENKALSPVFADLFDPEGSEIYLKRAGDYVALGEPVNFYTVVAAARQRGEVAIGYRLCAYSGDVKRTYGVTVNPDKSVQVTFASEDKIIVLAES